MTDLTGTFLSLAAWVFQQKPQFIQALTLPVERVKKNKAGDPVAVISIPPEVAKDLKRDPELRDLYLLVHIGRDAMKEFDLEAETGLILPPGVSAGN